MSPRIGRHLDDPFKKGIDMEGAKDILQAKGKYVACSRLLQPNRRHALNELAELSSLHGVEENDVDIGLRRGHAARSSRQRTRQAKACHHGKHWTLGDSN